METQATLQPGDSVFSYIILVFKGILVFMINVHRAVQDTAMD